MDAWGWGKGAVGSYIARSKRLLNIPTASNALEWAIGWWRWWVCWITMKLPPTFMGVVVVISSVLPLLLLLLPAPPVGRERVVVENNLDAKEEEEERAWVYRPENG